MRINEIETPKIIKINNKFSRALDLVIDAFTDHMDESSILGYIKDTVDWNQSVYLVLNDEVIGCYLFGKRNMLDFVQNCEIKTDLSKYENLKGIEGIAVVVASEYQKKGYGNKLKNYPKSIGVDYIWGVQLKSLNNLEDWLKRRELIADCGAWVTAEIF